MPRFWMVPLFLSPLLLHGYVPGRTELGGPVTFRTDAANIQFQISDQVRGGLANTNGRRLITTDSDPVSAVRNVIATLNGIEDAGFRFADLIISPTEAISGDGINSISFADSDANRSIVRGALAVTRNLGFADGRLDEGDIFFNPDMLGDGSESLFATTGDPAANDIESTVLHEMLHALGADHSNVLGATMYPFGRDGETFARTLTADDIAYAVDVYPGPRAAARYGRIQGTATFAAGGPISAAGVAAADPATGIVIGGLTEPDGTYDIVVPPSSPGSGYVVYIEPLDGPVDASDVDRAADADIEFQVTFAPAAGLTNPVPVAAGQQVTVDIAAQPGPALVDILVLGFVDPVTRRVGRNQGPVEVPDAQAADLVMHGLGLDQIQSGSIQVLHSGVTALSNGINVNPRTTVNGLPEVTIPLRFATAGGPTQNLPAGGLGTIVITIGGATTAYTGALVFEGLGAPEAKPEFGSSSLLGAASFGQAATGGLASLFVGIAEFVGATAVASTVPLPAQLAETTVEFTPQGTSAVTKEQAAGVAAPLVFVSGPANQINLQIPWEVPPGIASVVVTAAGVVSDAVNIAIAEFAPGIFSFDSGAGRAVAFFNDGTIIQPVGTFGLAARPAAIGEAFSVLATGMGPTNPASVTGDSSSVGGTFVLRNTVAQPTVTIGGVPAQVFASILSPEFVGVYQVVVIPQAGTPAGDAVPIIIDIGGAMSRGDVTVAIAP